MYLKHTSLSRSSFGWLSQSQESLLCPFPVLGYWGLFSTSPRLPWPENPQLLFPLVDTKGTYNVVLSEFHFYPLFFFSPLLHGKINSSLIMSQIGMYRVSLHPSHWHQTWMPFCLLFCSVPFIIIRWLHTARFLKIWCQGSERQGNGERWTMQTNLFWFSLYH